LTDQVFTGPEPSRHRLVHDGNGRVRPIALVEPAPPGHGDPHHREEPRIDPSDQGILELAGWQRRFALDGERIVEIGPGRREMTR
jgi:hypothetical protein